MARIYTLAVFVVILFVPFSGLFAQENNMSNIWFTNTDCNELILRKLTSISNDKVVSEITIRDKNFIKNIMQRIESIPANGSEMIRFGSEAEKTKLIFSYDNHQQSQIDIINRKFKTPSTGFNEKENEVETSLYRDIDALLFPAINKIMLKVENLEIDFGDFTIRYLNTDYIPQPPNGPTIGPKHIMNFLLKDTVLNLETKLTVLSAQLPPQPLSIEVNKKKFILLTYESQYSEYSKAEERLDPHYFQIVDQLIE